MKFQSSIQKILPTVIAYLFILLFTYAAVSKLIEFEDFQTQLGQSPLLGAFASPISYAVIGIELLISLLLAIGRTRLYALYASFCLMVMFTTYIIIILNFTSFTPCSCGGVLESMGWTEHLIFNVVFIMLAAVGVGMNSQYSKLRKLLGLSSLLVFGTLVVTIVFLMSEKEIKRNNGFQRKYIPHALEELGNYPLESNAFYIAGIDDHFIYLGNYNAPLYLKAISKDLSNAQEIKIDIENYNLPYKRVRIEVSDGYFFVGDGTIPILFRGNTRDWNGKVFSHGDAYFYDFVSQDSTQLTFTTTSSKTGNLILAQLKKQTDSIEVKLSHDVLKVQADGTFDLDGLLLYDNEAIVYVYYYRNQFEMGNSSMNDLKTGKTIDTISKAQIDVAHYKKDNVYKRGKALKVHQYAAVFDGELYVHSDRLGKYENEEVLWSASIIDRYRTAKNEYIHSFYFYHQPNERLREFKTRNDTIIALVNDQLWMQRIRPKYYQ